MEPPTCEQLFTEDGCKPVHSEAVDPWRRGFYVVRVFRRDSDGTHWSAKYCLSNNDETNELRDGCAEIHQVEPVEETVIKYIAMGRP